VSESTLELIVLVGEDLRIFQLRDRTEVTLGRDPSNHVPIDHPSVSRRHALIRLGPPILIEDLGSANGTFVHGRASLAVAGKTEKLARLQGEAVPLAIGESLLLGAVSVVIRRRQSRPIDGPSTRDPKLAELYAQAARAAATPISVLLLGETGVGKEVLARWIHAQSPRAKQPFIGINCAALSETLLESELFGHEKGAFTGATQSRVGLFEAARDGTLFLDEVGELALSTQTKLLRVLEERAVLPLGGRTTRPIDTRFIAATNRDLEAEIRTARFREDLYYRLNGITLAIPPLRERTVEIEPLAQSFLEAACRQLERAPLSISPEALRLLEAHPWPGNVRELRNVIERAVVLCPDRTISPEYLPASFSAGSAARVASVAAPAELDPARFEEQIEELRRARIVDALGRCAGNQTKAAKLLGIARRTLVAQLVELKIPRPRVRGTNG
jgi:DNA-binding NtrC family response regulator